jgi:NAD(P)-dependent dehydrogenase (short-subunit alcohol dehydrogenase family)
MTNNAGLKFSDALPAGWAVVTGAASGLGFAICKELGRDCNLILIDSDASGLAKAHQKLGGGGHRIDTILGDVSDAETWVQARACLGGVAPQWLAQCAGIVVSGTIAEAPIEHWRKALDVNLLGIVLGCRTFAGDMAHAGKGHIIHIASRAAITAVPRFGPYVVSKAAVVAMTETLYNEIGDHVTITVACPSYFRSNLVDRMVAQTEVERRALERMISGSPRSAEDMAAAILRAARRGDLYFFPPGEDRRLWRLKRLMPQRTLRFLRAKFRMMLRQLDE